MKSVFIYLKKKKQQLYEPDLNWSQMNNKNLVDYIWNGWMKKGLKVLYFNLLVFISVL